MKKAIMLLLMALTVGLAKAQDTTTIYKILPDDYASHKVSVQVQNRDNFSWYCEGAKLFLPEEYTFEKDARIYLLHLTWRLRLLDSATVASHGIGSTKPNFSLYIYVDGEVYDTITFFMPYGMFSKLLGYVKPADNDYCALFQTLVE